MHSIQFDALNLNPSLLRALAAEGYQQPTPIQQEAIPKVLAGKDLLATAQTGTGKTAAFSLPVLQMLGGRKGRGPIRALVLTPTRELALQIDESFRNYGRFLPLKSTVVLGGVPIGAQVRALRKRPDILIATPGRLLDLIGQGYLALDQIEILVLDEADRMLDMGFVHDVRRIVKVLPRKRQTVLFSATLSSEIAELAADMLHEPVKVEVTPPASVSQQIDQQVLFVDQGAKWEVLVQLLKREDVRRALVFTRTRRRANRVMKQLCSQGIAADAIHADKTQGARQRALAAFDRGRIKVLVATDIVARGIDVEGISHVINYDLPNDKESYVHRIGRTARAGATGISISFCEADEVSVLQGIERLIKKPLTVVEDPQFSLPSPVGKPQDKSGQRSAKRWRGGEGERAENRAKKRRGRKKGRDAKGVKPSGPDMNSQKNPPVRQGAYEHVAQGEAMRPQREFGRRNRPARVAS